MSAVAAVQAAVRGEPVEGHNELRQPERERLLAALGQAPGVLDNLETWIRAMDRDGRRDDKGAPAPGAGSDEARAMAREASSLLRGYLRGDACRDGSFKTMLALWTLRSAIAAWRRTASDSFHELYGGAPAERYIDAKRVCAFLDGMTYPRNCHKLYDLSHAEFGRRQSRFARGVGGAPGGGDAMTAERVVWTLSMVANLRAMRKQASDVAVPGFIEGRLHEWFDAQLTANVPHSLLLKGAEEATFTELLPMCMPAWSASTTGFSLIVAHDPLSDARRLLPKETFQSIMARCALRPSKDTEKVMADKRLRDLWYLRLWACVFESAMPPEASERLTGRQHKQVTLRFIADHVVQWSALTKAAQFRKTMRAREEDVSHQCPVIVDTGHDWLLLVFEQRSTQYYRHDDVRGAIAQWYTSLATTCNMRMPGGIRLPRVPWYTTADNERISAALNRG